MDRQLTIEPQGDSFHLFFHNYAGPAEGHRISDELGLEEVQPPPEEPDPQVLKPGQCFLWQPMGFPPDLHAVVPQDKLEAVSELVRDLDITVTEGEEFLPGSKKDGGGPEDQATTPGSGAGDSGDRHDLSYVEIFEKRHESVWHRGPKAVLGAFLIRAIPAAIVIALLVVASRHFGDHHQEATIDQVFARARQPNVEQSFFEGLVNPDHSRLLRTRILAVRYLRQNQLILADGNYLAIQGVGDLRRIFDRAQEANTPPVLDLVVRDGTVHVQQISLGSEVVAEDAVLARLAKLGPSAAMPDRGSGSREGQYREFQEIYFDDNDVLSEVEDERISLVGTLESDGERHILRMHDGGGVVLKESRRSTKAASDLMAHLADSGAEVRVDMVLDTIYPWRNRSDPEKSREATRLLGEAEVHSFSLQNYHLLARR